MKTIEDNREEYRKELNNLMKANGIKLSDMLTVNEFIKLCENEYGGEIIKDLKERQIKNNFIQKKGFNK